FWVPKGKAIYELGGLDEGFFTSLPGAAYPPLVPTLDAAAFHGMGSADVVTLHTQYWLFGVGLVLVLATVLVLYWLLDRQRWRLVVATALLCGMVLTKREGLLLFAVLLGASLVASAREWR